MMVKTKKMLIIITILTLWFYVAYADENDEEYEIEEFEREENGENLGSVAVYFLLLGLIFPAFKYVAPLLNIDQKRLFRIRMKYSTYYHGILMILATFIATLHHFSVEREIFGYPAFVIMLWLVITGILMKFSVEPNTKRYASIIHFQRIFTGLMLLFILLHIKLGES